MWVGGGWGVEALAGAGFRGTLDQRPVRFVAADPAGRELDLHPLEFASHGSATQASFDPAAPFRYPAACFVTGRIGGAAVPCLSAEQQAYFHQGYRPTARDLHDMALLREEFGIATHF
ncbi:amino acid transporter [Kitasatospora sp. NPDC049285]|uniref:nucleotidyltransferase domain-containing protein n=1 Tax=Kitasatospora sp. NPDC049285 TaxID=3157096 RepID=UPI00342E07DC